MACDFLIEHYLLMGVVSHKHHKKESVLTMHRKLTSSELRTVAIVIGDVESKDITNTRDLANFLHLPGTSNVVDLFQALSLYADAQRQCRKTTQGRFTDMGKIFNLPDAEIGKIWRTYYQQCVENPEAVSEDIGIIANGDVIINGTVTLINELTERLSVVEKKTTRLSEDGASFSGIAQEARFA